MTTGAGSILIVLVLPILFLLPLLAVIFGTVGLVKIRRSQGSLKGAGLAWTGILVGGFLLLALPILAGVLLLGTQVTTA